MLVIKASAVDVSLQKMSSIRVASNEWNSDSVAAVPVHSASCPSVARPVQGVLRR